MAIIEARDLSKSYTVVKNKKQFLKSLIAPQKEIVHAVNNIDLHIHKAAKRVREADWCSIWQSKSVVVGFTGKRFL